MRSGASKNRVSLIFSQETHGLRIIGCPLIVESPSALSDIYTDKRPQKMSRFLNRPCMRRQECACVSVDVDICYCFFSLKEARFVLYSRIICHKSQMLRNYFISNMNHSAVEFWMTMKS